MNYKIFLILLCLNIKAVIPQQEILNKSLIDRISGQLVRKENIIGLKNPEYTENGTWKFGEKVNWLSGFLSGELWYMHEITGNEDFKKLAVSQADKLISFSGIDYTHDMGFIFLPSCYKSYKITGDKKYLKAMLKAAEMLAKRFNEKGNFIRAWGSLNDTSRAGLSIIDTMMNLELLFLAAQETGSNEYFDIAYKHALTTLNEIVRNDYSSYHVVKFDPGNGNVLGKQTHQGFGDESTWARGQAWGIYGFANTFKYTGDERFLFCSQKMADYFIEHLPADLVPVWDLDLDELKEPRDASAGAIAASGLFLLGEISETRSAAEKYHLYAEKITASLINNYLFVNSKRKNEEGILLHTIYHYHKKWGVDESFPAGDYYFLEALAKYHNYRRNENFIKSENSRNEYCLNQNWYYLEDNSKDIAGIDKSGNEWKKINLPHTWNKTDATDNIPGYRRGMGWYQKNIYIPHFNEDMNFILHFEGVNISSEVFVNKQKAGGHTGGYIGFDINLTPYIKEGEINQILVRADNSINRDIIPSQKSDFNIYGGINRDVTLKIVPSSFIDRIKISSPEVSGKKASTNVNVEFSTALNTRFEIKIFIKNSEGVIVSHSSVKKNSEERLNEINLILPEIKDPQLWSPDNPELYNVIAELHSAGKLIDRVEEKHGYRWFEFKPFGAFYLNGKRLLLRGTHWHEDYAGYGNAVPDSLKIKDFKMIKNMGANFIRLAHYPQDPKIYELCDELGILVWDELPWCRGGVGEETWKNNTKSMLAEMIDQNFNHPSIIIWSLGNEIYWLPDFQGGDNNDSIISFLKELNNIAHQKDPNRLTAVRKYYEGSGIVDVFSPSIWAGWYSGVYKNYAAAIEDSRKKYPALLHMEYGGSSLLGRHNENPVDGDGVLNPDEWEENISQVKIKSISSMGGWDENYIVDLFDWYLKYSETADNFTGNAQWAFKDFGTPLRPENPIPYMNQKGLVDRSGNPKDAFYVFKSFWNKNDKFCYIESHTWTERSGPENIAREVNVYSNCDTVELFHNGKSLGKKIKDINNFPASGLSWKIIFGEGENNLSAAGYYDGKTVADNISVSYTYKKPGIPERINLTAERIKNRYYLVTAIVVDNKGQRCLNYNKRIYFSVNGPGKLIENLGTSTGSSVIEAANGKAQILFESTGFDPTIIEVRNQDFKGDYLQIN